MAVRAGALVFTAWRSLRLGNGWSDTFLFSLSVEAGLPPKTYAGPLRRMARQLERTRPGASLWVQVAASGGRWYREAVSQALRGLPLATAVTWDWEPLRLADFSFCPGLFREPVPPPPTAPELMPDDLSEQEVRALRVMARLETAYTAEVASLMGVSLPTARKALRGLQSAGLIDRDGEQASPCWAIRRAGVSKALRSWGLAPGVAFPGRRERTSATGRHRRTARLWPAWLRRAWPQAQIWAGWSEVSLGRLRPDGLAWGQLDGREALFWLEVESGHASREMVKHKAIRRFDRALYYAQQFSLSLVFALLGPPWVRRAAVGSFIDVPGDAAVVLTDWKAFGELPMPRWGYVWLD